MRHRNKTYLYAGALALAVIGLITDRVLRSGPQDAAAVETQGSFNTAPHETGSPATPQQRKAAAPAGPASCESASRWLRDLPEIPEVRDLFAPANLFPAEGDAADTAGRKTVDPVAEFASSHQLSATFQDARTRCAVVNGRIVRPGQIMDGFQLIRVESFQATFRRGRHEATLFMAPADATENTEPPPR